MLWEASSASTSPWGSFEAPNDWLLKSMHDKKHLSSNRTPLANARCVVRASTANQAKVTSQPRHGNGRLNGRVLHQDHEEFCRVERVLLQIFPHCHRAITVPEPRHTTSWWPPKYSTELKIKVLEHSTSPEREFLRRTGTLELI